MTEPSPLTPYDAALIGNCQSALLVDKHATITWGCLPTFSSASVFARVLDPQGGHFSIAIDGAAPVSQAYVPLTNVLVTRFEGPGIAVDVMDWMPRYIDGPHYIRAPTVYRLFKVRAGHPRVTIELEPKPGYARKRVRVTHLGDRLRYDTDDQVFFAASNMPLARILNKEALTLRGDAYVAFSTGEPPKARSLHEVESDLENTLDYWRTWSRRCHLPLDYQEPILRSALALKLLTFQDSGAVLAAPTTSLPEVPGGPRNWDYRYCWLRDSFFTVRALARLAHIEEDGRFLSYVSQLPLAPGRLQPVYGIAGECDLFEETLDHFEGAFGSKPVRIGNQAFEHVQNDVYGELMLALTPAFFDIRFADEPHRQLLWAVVKVLADDVLKVWRQKDAGIWEYRDKSNHYVFSKLMCWVALDRGALIADRMGETATARRWRLESTQIRAEVSERGWNEKLGAFAGAYDTDTLDAANFLLAPTGFLKPDDPRYVDTVRAIERRLVENGLCFRYRSDDDFGTPESTFSICTLWYVDALRLIGEREKAREVFESFLARQNHVGLFSEGIHPTTGRPTGNFPQAYTHVALINSGMMLSRHWGDIGARDFEHVRPEETEDPLLDHEEGLA